MIMQRHSTIFLPVLLLTLLLQGCSDPPSDRVSGPPEPGELKVVLTASKDDATALLFTITGPAPITKVRLAIANSIYYNRSRLFHRVRDDTAQLAVFGNLKTGDLVRFTVPDLREAEAYEARLLEAIDSKGELHIHIPNYTLKISR